MKVKLDTIIGGLDMVSDTFDVYFNPKTGEIDFIDRFSTPSFYTDEEDSIPEDAIFLPSQFEIHEYSIMEDFVYTIEDKEIYEELLFAIRGRGHFGILNIKFIASVFKMTGMILRKKNLLVLQKIGVNNTRFHTKNNMLNRICLEGFLNESTI